MTRFSLFRLPVLALGMAFLLAACDATVDDSTADLTAAEADEAAAIVAEALAEDAGGFFASTADLTAALEDDSMASGPQALGGHRDRRGSHLRCRNGDYVLTYDEVTGTHLVTYECSVDTGTAQRSYSAQLTYQYRDADGGFVARPVEEWDTVDSVAFGGTREGEGQFGRGEFSRTSMFEQDGAWTLSGLADNTTPAILSGRQQRSGIHAQTGPGGSGTRTFSAELSGEGIELREGDDGLGMAAVGTLSYTVEMEIERNGAIVTRTVEGTIELENSGFGLLRIIGIRGLYRVSLGDGALEFTP
ncbi:MAG: hypothetical protein AAGI91_11000 [Bacteroidota bacterium]